MRVSLDLSPLHRFADTVYLLFVNSVQIDEGIDMKKKLLIWTCASLFLVGLFSGCWGGGPSTIVVNSLEDMSDPPEGTVTIRDAIARIKSGGKIIFDESLSGGTIDLNIIGKEHSILRGEVFWRGFRFDGYLERDFGASALYVNKNLTIDASDLPDGITLNWTGGEDNPARVLAVYGDLTMDNVNISSGVASAVALSSTTQPYTLARGAGVATWGVAHLNNCEISGNQAFGDTESGRDRAAYGGGIYGNVLILEDCVISGNLVRGYGAAGGGVNSIGGWDSTQNSRLTRCSVTGNRIEGQFAYGGGVYSDGGGRGNTEPITITSSTIARNLVMHHPDIPEPDPASAEFYYRGGGFYMSNGYLWLDGSTIAENVVNGYVATFHERPNVGGGGAAATIGLAHVAEDMQIQHSIIAGNIVNGEPGDLFTGSLIDFFSRGYNLIGDLNFDYIHVPVPWWNYYLSRKHYPKEGDQDGVQVSDVLSLGSIQYHPTIQSVGVSPGQNTVLWYPPAGDALNAIPAAGYLVTYIKAGFNTSSPFGEGTGFLEGVLDEIEIRYGQDYSSVFGTQDLSVVTFHGPAGDWPDPDDYPENIPWITFWRDLDAAIAASPGPLGTEKLADGFWGEPFDGDDGPNIHPSTTIVSPVDTDQLGNARPAAGAMGDIGAIELP